MSDKEGYITIATEKSDIHNSFILANSLRKFDPLRKIALFTDEFLKIPKEYKKAFDFILELPYGNTNYKKEDVEANINCWQLYYCDLFEKILYIDPSSVVTSNIEFLWDCTKKDSIRLVNCINSIKGKDSVYSYKNNIFLENDMDVIFGGMLYFNKERDIENFFKILDVISQNWNPFVSEYIKEHRPKYFDLGVGLSITSKILEEKFHNNNTWFSYTNIKGVKMTKEPDIWLNEDFSLHINNYCQYGILSHNNKSIREIYYDRITEEKK